MNNEYKFKRYWPVPPIIDSVYEYQDVNNDKNLQKDVTKFFYKKLLLWISEDNNFDKFKKKINKIENDGIRIVYILLKKFITRTHINWYDLRDNYKLIKKFFYIKLSSIF
jgi:predicted enzyme involved in methoxymalonyl-ACP biosynthesis|uniref:Uncharacterized protein n=1 Tax=viral metagenome TaxID=1070528 RepID=A0A6C0EFS5_9ZZZZ